MSKMIDEVTKDIKDTDNDTAETDGLSGESADEE